MVLGEYYSRGNTKSKELAMAAMVQLLCVVLVGAVDGDGLYCGRGGWRAGGSMKLVPAAALANILIPKYLRHLHRFSHLNGCTDS